MLKGELLEDVACNEKFVDIYNVLVLCICRLTSICIAMSCLWQIIKLRIVKSGRKPTRFHLIFFLHKNKR